MSWEELCEEKSDLCPINDDNFTDRKHTNTHLEAENWTLKY